MAAGWVELAGSVGSPELVAATEPVAAAEPLLSAAPRVPPELQGPAAAERSEPVTGEAGTARRWPDPRPALSRLPPTPATSALLASSCFSVIARLSFPCLLTSSLLKAYPCMTDATPPAPLCLPHDETAALRR